MKFDDENDTVTLKTSVKLRLCHNYIKEKPEIKNPEAKLKLSNGRREANLQKWRKETIMCRGRRIN